MMIGIPSGWEEIAAFNCDKRKTFPMHMYNLYDIEKAENGVIISYYDELYTYDWTVLEGIADA